MSAAIASLSASRASSTFFRLSAMIGLARTGDDRLHHCRELRIDVPYLLPQSVDNSLALARVEFDPAGLQLVPDRPEGCGHSIEAPRAIAVAAIATGKHRFDA